MKHTATTEQLLTDLLTAILGDRTAEIIHDYGLASAVEDAITTVQTWSQELWPSLDDHDAELPSPPGGGSLPRGCEVNRKLRDAQRGKGKWTVADYEWLVDALCNLTGANSADKQTASRTYRDDD